MVQEVIAGQGPIVQFLIKRELVWVPIIGWICLVLNFPRLHRSGAASDRAQDLAAIESAAQKLGRAPGALLVFAEGSRFSAEKSKRFKARRIPHLLKPKVGGLSTMLKYARPDTPVLDLTISYAAGQAQFWRCLHGGTPRIRIRVEEFLAADITDPEAWLKQTLAGQIGLAGRRTVEANERPSLEAAEVIRRGLVKILIQGWGCHHRPGHLFATRGTRPASSKSLRT